jgi:hypothetical protein
MDVYIYVYGKNRNWQVKKSREIVMARKAKARMVMMDGVVRASKSRS